MDAPNFMGSKKTWITRRDFLKYSATAGVMLGMPSIFQGCSDSSSTAPSPSGNREVRSYYFDFSETGDDYDYHLVAGSKWTKLEKVTSSVLSDLQKKNPMMALISDEYLTHYHPELLLPADAVQMCWIMAEKKGTSDKSWSMPLIFFHLPRRALVNAFHRRDASGGNLSAKWQTYGVEFELNEENHYIAEDDFKVWMDLAVCLVNNHPELLSGDPDSSAHIQKNIIQAQGNTIQLAVQLKNQGPATEQGGWATLVPYINPDTGQPYLNTQGKKQVSTHWSETTGIFAAKAMQPSLVQAKNDETLGTNITNLSPDQENEQVRGTVWKVMDGNPLVVHPAAGAPLDSEPFSYGLKEHNKDHGYSISVDSVDYNAKTIEVKAHNWYCRFLGLYVRFIDANDNPIKVSSLSKEVKSYFPTWAENYNGTYDNLALIMESELEVLAIPVKSYTKKFTFLVPEEASKILILAGGLGTGSTDYSDTLKPGVIMTSLFNLAFPSIFIAAAAATAFSDFYLGMSEWANEINFLVAFITDVAFDSVALGKYHDPKEFMNLAVAVGTWLLSRGGWCVKELNKAIAEGEATDEIPLIGMMLQAVALAGLVMQLAQSVEEVITSPKTYTAEIALTHNITVTLSMDKDDYEFPAVATYYKLTIAFDRGGPQTTEKIPMPDQSGGLGTWSDPIDYTFEHVPYGGVVKISVGFYSDTDWLAGQGTTGDDANQGWVDNTQSAFSIQITENEVPLQIDTLYSHKEKTALDDQGNVMWKTTPTAPHQTNIDLNCGNTPGNLCALTGITVSQTFGAAGYSWKANSRNLHSCETGSSGQLHAVGGISLMQDPENGHFRSPCGFSAPPRIAYDLMRADQGSFYLDTTNGQQIVREIRLTLDGKPSIDWPGSNQAWGTFSNPSDAMLFHPAGKIVSICAEHNKIEVLTLGSQFFPDDDAPIAQAYSGTGIREGLVDGPVAADITPQGALLILESRNKRIQAFDMGINPAPYFKEGKYHVPLKEETGTITYLDIAVEYTGYIYVLSYDENNLYRLDIYTPDGDWLTRTTGVNAACLDVDYWRIVYTLNYEILMKPDGSLPDVTEPSVSQWIPSTP